MKRLSYLVIGFILINLAVVQTGCKTDDPFVPSDEAATLDLNIYAKVGNSDFAFGDIYMDPSSYRYSPNLFKLYLSNITLIKDDNTEVLVKDVVLLDWENNTTGEPQTVTLEAEPGNYTGIRFWLGVDQALNDLGPGDYDAEHPLSLYQGTYWAWNTGYRFVMLEGKYDTIANGTGAIPTNNNFQLHLGTNFLYTEADLNSAQQNYELTAGNTTQYDLELDVNKMFTDGQQTLKIADQPYNHTTEDTATAVKYMNNLSKAFSLK